MKKIPVKTASKAFTEPSKIPGLIAEKKVVPFIVWHSIRKIGMSLENGNADFFRGEWFAKIEHVFTPAEFSALRDYFMSITYDMEEYSRNHESVFNEGTEN
jgi:hypothetical protein